MEAIILSTLKTIGYDISEDDFRGALNQAPQSVDYTKIVNFMTTELRSLCALDEQVNIIAVPEDSVSFLMEISSFLKELGCPHESLSQGELMDRLKTLDDKLLLLDYLSSKLLAARMQQAKKPDKKIKLKVQETLEAHHLQVILNTLGCPKETENLPLKELLDKLTLRLETVVTERGKDLLSSPIWNHQLTDQQWEKVGSVELALHDEYTIRRKMMLQRLDCTIQSFQWSDKMKNKGELIMKTYADKRKQLKVEPDVDISSLLAARDDLAVIEKTSNSSVRKNTQSKVNKVVIGKVPDRGGRTADQAVPTPEMPSWQARQSGGGGGRGGRGGGRGGDKGSYNRGGYANQRGGGGGGFHQDNRQKAQQHSFDAAGPYTTAHHHPSSANNYNNQQQRNYRQQNAGDQQYGNQRYEEQYQNDPKRPRTYDSFQNQKQTYADQYVQESQHNQQHQPRRGGGGRGRSNYHRGGRGGAGGSGGYGQNYY